MASKKKKKGKQKDLSTTQRKEELVWHEVQHHHQIGFDETENRATGTGRIGSISFDEADELFRSYLDEDCVTPDTEVLTQEGFKKIPDVTEEDEVLSLNPDTGFAEYVSDCGLAVHDHDGPMVHFNGRSIDLMTNPVHRMWAGNRYGHNPDHEDFEFKLSLTFLDRSPDHIAFNNKIRFEGKNVADWDIPELKSGKDYMAKLNHKFDALDFAEFMGWYLSEGSCEVTPENSYYRVHISQTKSDNIPGILDVIERLGFNPHINGSNIVFSAFTLAHWLKQFGHARDKFVPRDLLNAQAPVRQVLLETLLKGDGHWPSETRWRYTTLSKQLADDVQELALKTGYYASIANSQKTKNGDTIYRVCGSVSKTGNIYAKEFVEEDYKGKIYSLYMPKNHVYLARRNGKCVWTGNSWPYDALLFDPRVFTFIFEKTSRLIASKPKAHLIPREGSDMLAAKVNNALLNHQWDQATNGGTMLQKWALMDINTRKYGASFALCKWRYETGKKGNVLFDGPEMQVLNNRDVAHDLTATAIENANWVQVRKYVTLQELERVNDHARSKPIYKNISELRTAIGKKSTEGGGGDTRSSNWRSRNREISNLEVDPIGKDEVFKSVEVVTEYRRDRWITFAPQHGVVLRDIPNPYGNNEIPIVMLRYYVIDDDLYGLSEIEPVKGIQKAINALLCQYVDEINQNLYSPIAIGPGVRQHTLEWGKGARWIMSNPMTDFRLVESRSNAAQYFNNTYSVLVSAMMNALGESSLGVSNLKPFQQDKTATEVKALQLQRNARDNYNQLLLGESMKRQMMLWHTMNQKLIFSDPDKRTYAIRIVGKDALSYFKKKGLGADQMDDISVKWLKKQAEILDLSFEELSKIVDVEGHKMPKFPVNMGDKKDIKLSPKMEEDELGDGAVIHVEPEDLKGNFDFSIDVESMVVSADEERRQGRQTAVSLLVSNPNILALLQQEGVKPKFKELFVTWLEDLGFTDADKYFGKVEQPAVPGAPGAQGGPAGDRMQQLVGMLGGGPNRKGGQGGADPQEQLKKALENMNQGTGASQMGNVMPDMAKPTPPTQQNMGQPRPEQLQKMQNRYGG